MTTFDAATSGQANAPGTATWSHAVGGGGNRLLIVFVGALNGALASTVTYGGTSLTRLGDAASIFADADVWYMTAPPAGTASVVVTLASSNSSQSIAMSFSNANQATPFGALQSAAPTSNTQNSPTLTVTDSASADFIAAFANISDSSYTMSCSSTGAITRNGNPGHGLASNNQSMAVTIPGASGSVTVNFGTQTGNVPIWAVAAVAVKDGTVPPPPWRPPAIQAHSRAVARASVI